MAVFTIGSSSVSGNNGGGDPPPSGGAVGGADNLTNNGAITQVSGAGVISESFVSQSGGTVTVEDTTAVTGDTSFVVKGGAGQLSDYFQVQNNAGDLQFSVTEGTAIVTTGNDYVQFSASTGAVNALRDTSGKATLSTTSLVVTDVDALAATPFAINASTTTIQDTTATTGDTKLVVKAGAGQAGNLQEWQDAAGGVAVSITSDGSIGLTYLADPIFQTAISPGLLEFYGDSSQSLQLDANTPSTLRIVASTGGGDRNALAVNASTTTIQDTTATTGATLVDIVAGAAQTTKSVVMQTGGRIQAPLTTPTTSGETGTAGTIAWDASYIYICTSANTWKRVALSAF